MERIEIAVWRSSDRGVTKGEVVKRGRSATAAVTVRWHDGNVEQVKGNDPTVRFAYVDTRRLEWLVTPEVLQKDLRKDRLTVALHVLRDEGKPLSGPAIAKKLVEVGMDPAEAKRLVAEVKAALERNWHVSKIKQSFSWVETATDPFGHLRSKPGIEAFEFLIGNSKIKAEEKDALADAVRLALGQKINPHDATECAFC